MQQAIVTRKCSWFCNHDRRAYLEILTFPATSDCFTRLRSWKIGLICSLTEKNSVWRLLRRTPLHRSCLIILSLGFLNPSLFGWVVIWILPRGGRQTVGENWYRRGGHQSPQYSSPPKGQRTKEPLRETTPSSTTANSTTNATTKQKLEKTTIAYYFGVLHH
jgi:hypothetical protein